MSKTNEELVKQFKKANKVYKLKLASRLGVSMEEYIKNIMAPKSIPIAAPKTSKKRIKVPTTKQKVDFIIPPTIHIVDILDASGSMEGGKYDNSKKGILAGIKDLKGDYTYTLVEFIDSRRTNNVCFMEPAPSWVNFYGALGNDTPLYKVVYETLVKLNKAVSRKDKVLVKIYTDGLNNTFYEYTEKAKLAIAELQERGFTITFVATDRDLGSITKDLRLESTNTLAVANSAEGFDRAFARSRAATVSYMSAVSKGEDVSKGFYKKVVKL